MNDALPPPVHKVLIIAGSPAERAAYQRFFKRARGCRYQVLEAESIADGLVLWRAQRPSCVLLECADEAGLASLKILVAESGADRCGMVAVVNTNNLQMAIAALEAGAHDYLEKSGLTAKTLLRAVNHAIERVGLYRQLDTQREQLRDSEANLTAELAHERQLQKISSQLIQENNVHTLYEPIVAAAITVMQADTGSLQMFSAEKNELLLLAWRGFHPDSAQFWERVPISASSSCGVALRQGQRVIVPDVETCEFMVGIPDLHHYRLSGLRAMQSTPLVSRDGRLVGMISTHWHKIHQPSEKDLFLLDVLARQAADLIERKVAEENLRESEERYRALVEATAQIVWTMDAEGRSDAHRHWFAQLTGEPIEAIKGKGYLNFIHPDDREYLQKVWFQVQKKPAPYEVEFRLAPKHDHYYYYNLRGVPLFNRDGSLREWIGTVRDVTDEREARKALHQSEERYRGIVNQTVGGIAEVDLTGTFTTVNHRFCEITGYARRQLLGGMRMQDITHPEDLPANLEKFQQLVTDGTAFEIEKRYVRQDGSVVWVNNSVSAIKEAAGQISSVVAVVVDITERKRVEQALRESENQLRVVTNAMPALISYIDADCRYRFVNETYTNWFGHTSAEVIGKTMQEVLGEAAFSVLRPHVAAALAGTTETFEAETPYREGGTRYIRATYTPDVAADGTVRGFFVLVLDITERKRAEAAQAYLAAIIESSDDAVISKNLQGIITSWNHGAEKLFGYTAEEIIGKPVLLLLPSHLEEEEAHILETIRRGQSIVRHETVRVRKDGTTVEISLTVSPIRNPAGEIIGASKIARNITERKRHERNTAFLADISQELLHLASEREIMQMIGAKLGAFLQLSHCVFVEINEAADEVTSLYDWHRADVPNLGGTRRISDYVTPEVLAAIRAGELMIVRDTATDPRVNAAANAALKIGSYVGVPLIRDGEWRFVLAVHRSEASAWRTDEIELIRELTTRIWTSIERARAEEALRAEEERYRILFNSIDEGFCLIEMLFDADDKPFDYRLVQANPAFTRLIGFPAAVLGKTARELVPDLPDFWFMTYGQVAVTGAAVRFENYAAPLRRWFEVYASRVGDDTSRRVAVVFNDITERKQAEAEREHLLQKEKQLRATAEAHNRAKDEFLAVVSHELRNPLNSILGYARLTRTNPHDTAQVVQHCEIIERNARMQQQLIEDLLDTARIISGKLQIETAPLDFRLVIEDALAVVRSAAAAKRIDLRAQLGVEPQPLLGDAARLQQVVWNLLQNAIKFTPDGGRVEVLLERNTTQLQLRVSDTGRGIEAEFLPAIFDRFSQSDMSRTRRHGGLGLGLALAKQLIELHGGTIEAASAGLDRGATFTVSLPLQAQRETSFTLSHASPVLHESEALPLIELPRLDGARILVVDDQEEARQLVTTMLVEWGAEVTTAASGQEAETWLTRQAFDVLVCDIAMPEMDGYSLVQRQRAREQQQQIPLTERLPAVALTAHARPEDRLRALSAGFQMHIAKPIELAELVLVIGHLLGPRHTIAQS